MAAPMRIEKQPVLATVTLAAGALVVLFWAFYFTETATLGQGHPVKRIFEAAFPAADAVLATALVATGVLLLLRRASAAFTLVIAASMSLYLGVLDATFYLRHGFYSPLTSDALTEIAINVLCVGGGILGLRLGWRLWRTM
jgi:hypothetical protein